MTIRLIEDISDEVYYIIILFIIKYKENKGNADNGIAESYADELTEQTGKAGQMHKRLINQCFFKSEKRCQMEDWVKERKRDERKKIENFQKIMKEERKEIFEILLKCAEREYEEIEKIEGVKLRCRNIFTAEEKEEEKMSGEEIFDEIIKLREKETEGFEDYEVFDVDFFLRKYNVDVKKRGNIIKIGERYFYKKMK